MTSQTRNADSNTASFSTNATSTGSSDPPGIPGSFLQSSGPSFESTTTTSATNPPATTSQSNRSNVSNPPQMMGTVPLTMPARVVPREPLVPKRRLIIRADPTMVSCFDPKDKELYDLWAPKP